MTRWNRSRVQSFLCRSLLACVLAAGIGEAGGIGAASLATAAPAGGGDAASLRAETSPDSALVRALASIGGEDLSLADAATAALRHAPGVRQAVAGYLAARGSRMRERGAFDPELFATAQKSKEDQPNASPFGGGSVLKPEVTTATAGARIALPLGTEISASVNSVRTGTNSTFAAYNPQFNATGRIEVTQPLLKGFGPAASGDLSAAGRDLAAAEADYADAALATRADVEGAYWDLYAAERDLAVQQVIRDRAVALLREADLKARAGLVGPDQPANARVFVAEQEQAVLDREDRLDEISDQLATLMGRRPATGTARFRAVDEPPRDFAVSPADSVVARAFRGNFALRARAFDVESARARARSARWNALPALDLYGSLGGNGLTGTGQEIIFGGDTLRTATNGGRSRSLRQVLDRDYPTWSAGVRFSLPLGLREGRGERDRAGAEVRRAEETLVAARRGVEEAVRSGQRELAGGARRLALSRDGVEASLEQVRIGLLEYQSGRTTAFELVRLGADLAAAQQRYSQALVRSARAAARLRSLAGEGEVPSPDSLEETR
jgi:outer membrane protein TolC